MADESLTRLTGLIEEMASRLAALERQGGGELPIEGLGRTLGRRVGDDLRAGRRIAPTGELLWAGSYWPSDEVSFSWEERRTTEELLAVGDEGPARVLASFASPTRLRLVKTLLLGERAANELMAELNLHTTGQLYHHLHELIACEVVVQRARSRYALNQSRLRSVLAVLMAGLELDGSGATPEV